jgi:hypothetical protein
MLAGCEGLDVIRREAKGVDVVERISDGQREDLAIVRWS